MIAEIIAIGDELSSGQRLDTNSQWLSRSLADLGIAVHFHTTVRDDIAENTDVFRIAARRADLAICTGGLGPTADDLTREAIAAAANVELEFREPTFEHIRAMYESRGRNMPERNRVQAMFPIGAKVIPNPHGTAPGVDFTFQKEGQSNCRIFALPGVPAEMKEMWRDTVASTVLEMIGGRQRVIRHRAIKCFGVGESTLEEMLPDLIARGRTPTVGITVSKATITLRIRAVGESAEDCQAQIEPTEAIIRNKLGDLVFGEEEDELPNVLLRLLADRNETLATLECATQGMLASQLAAADTAGRYFLGGAIGSNAAVVRNQLKIAAADSVDSHEIQEWAKRVRAQHQSDWSIVIGPAMGSKNNHPDDSVFIAIDGPLPSPVKKGTLLGHPDIIHARTVKQALNTLRLLIMNSSS